jgi:hypothetical protein
VAIDRPIRLVMTALRRQNRLSLCIREEYAAKLAESLHRYIRLEC